MVKIQNDTKKLMRQDHWKGLSEKAIAKKYGYSLLETRKVIFGENYDTKVLRGTLGKKHKKR